MYAWQITVTVVLNHCPGKPHWVLLFFYLCWSCAFKINSGCQKLLQAADVVCSCWLFFSLAITNISLNQYHYHPKPSNV